MKAVPEKPGRRFGLGWRLYGFGLLQVFALLLAALLWLVATRSGVESPASAFGERVVKAYAATLGSPTGSQERRALAFVSETSVAVYDGEGRALLLEGTAPPGPRSQEHAPLERSTRLMHPVPFTHNLEGSVPLTLPDGRKAYGVYSLPAPKPPSLSYGALFGLLALSLVGLGSVLMARNLVRPLEALVHAARRLGEGRFDTRVHIQRRDELGEVGRAFDDMAERVQRLVLAEKELMANVSHELRTPLSRIRVALELAAEGDGAQARHAFTAITEDLRDLDELIENVLTAGRLDLAGSDRGLKLQPVSMTALLEQTLHRFRHAHPERKLETTLPDEGPFLEVDAGLLRRAVDNLLSNAHHYSDAQRPITVVGEESAGAFRLTIQDEGVGIDPKDVARLFTPFFRADSSRNRATGGVGLGLVLTRRILEAHCGHVEVASTLGVGTTVTVTLPLTR